MLVNLPEKVCKFWQSKGSRAEIRDRFFLPAEGRSVGKITKDDLAVVLTSGESKDFESALEVAASGGPSCGASKNAFSQQRMFFSGAGV